MGSYMDGVAVFLCLVLVYLVYATGDLFVSFVSGAGIGVYVFNKVFIFLHKKRKNE